MTDTPTKRKRGRPAVADRLVSLPLKIRQSDLDRLDALRGDMPRGRWLLAQALAPGARARLTRPDDARLFAQFADAPLVDGSS